MLADEVDYAVGVDTHRDQHVLAARGYAEALRFARRIAEGKTRRDATRLLKRYLACHLYRLLQQQEPLMT